MFERDIEAGEIIVFRLHLGPLDDHKTHGGEDGADLLDDPGQRMAAAGGLADAGQGKVNAGLSLLPGGRATKGAAFLLEAGADRGLKLVDLPAELCALLGR